MHLTFVDSSIHQILEETQNNDRVYSEHIQLTWTKSWTIMNQIKSTRSSLIYYLFHTKIFDITIDVWNRNGFELIIVTRIYHKFSGKRCSLSQKTECTFFHASRFFYGYPRHIEDRQSVKNKTTQRFNSPNKCSSTTQFRFEKKNFF